MKTTTRVWVALVGALALIFGGSTVAVASGSDSPTLYTVGLHGIQLPDGYTFQDGGHVNIHTNQGNRGIHFESLNNQPSGKWIGQSYLPYEAFGFDVYSLCVTWVQLSQFNEHFGEGGQQPIGKGCKPTQSPSPSPTPSATPTVTPEPTPSATPTETPEPEPTPSETLTPSPSPSPTPSETLEPPVEPSETPTPVATVTPVPSVTPVTTPAPSLTPTAIHEARMLAETGGSSYQISVWAIIGWILVIGGAIATIIAFPSYRRAKK